MKTQIIFRSTPIGTLLFLIFLVLKLTDVIAWSWWWVTAPLWVPFYIWAVIIIGVCISAGLLFLLAFLAKLFGK